MKVHVLTNNMTRSRGIIAEHGLSLFIEHNGLNILFDTGQSDAYIKNAEIMGIDLGKTDLIILSHGHFDHCGGLIHFPFKQNTEELPKKDIPIYVREGTFEKKYAYESIENKYSEVGIPWSIDDYPDIKRNIVFTKGMEEITPGIYLCGEVRPDFSYEGVATDLLVDGEDGKIQDEMLDEQMLVIDAEEGLCVFLGCSHAGIVSSIRKLSHDIEEFDNISDKKIFSLAAGMHLDEANDDQIREILYQLTKTGCNKIMPLHCTGIKAISGMKTALEDKCLVLYAGDSYDII